MSSYHNTNRYDLIGIGLGPFNLGLATMLNKIPEVKALFFEQNPSFNWHPGLLLEGTTLQVPFFADLVTMADPTSRYSFLNYLHEQRRLYHFYFLEHFHIPRKEYNHYCKWVAEQLDSCQFGQKVTNIEWNKQDEYFQVHTLEVKTGKCYVYDANHLVLGVGTVPQISDKFQPLLSKDIFHSAQFLQHKDRCRQAKSITVIGSGQSAAEVFYQLLLEQETCDYRLNWLTRSAGFFPMEYSKLGLEYFSPDYTRYFYQLPEQTRDNRLKQQGLLFKGISMQTIAEIYGLLYERTIGGKKLAVDLCSQLEVGEIIKMDQHYRLQGHHLEQDQSFSLDSEVIIFGTGYQQKIPTCLDGIKELISWDKQNRYVIDEDYRLTLTKNMKSMIFVQNGEMHTHGVGTSDLGLGAHRNAIIINTLLGRQVYQVSERNVYQHFGVPAKMQSKDR